MGLFGGAKPIKPPAFYGEAARNSEAQYRKVLMFLTRMTPHIDKAYADTPGEWADVRKQIDNRRDEYIRENPMDKEFSDLGRELEYQTLQEVQDAGSPWRQEEAATSATEDFNNRYTQQIADAEIRARNYGRSAPGLFGSSAAQIAAAGAGVANEARELTRFRGEDVRRQFLPTAGAYGDSLISRIMQMENLERQDADLVAGLPAALSGIQGVYGDYLKNQVNPQQETAMRTNNILHQANQKYADLKSARSGRMFSNIASLALAYPTGGASLAGLRLGGGADGSGASAPFAWMGGGEGGQLTGLAQTGLSNLGSFFGGGGGVLPFNQRPGGGLAPVATATPAWTSPTTQPRGKISRLTGRIS